MDAETIDVGSKLGRRDVHVFCVCVCGGCDRGFVDRGAGRPYTGLGDIYVQ